MLLIIARYLIVYLYIFTTITSGYDVNRISYRHLTIEDDRLCSVITKRKIQLSRTEHSAVFVTQARTKDHTVRWAKNWDCKFQIEAPSNYGLFAVIQNINFRRNEETQECKDYIQFKTKDGRYSPRICGDEHIADLSLESWGQNSSLGMIDPKGKMDTFVYISRDPLLSGQDMDFNIVYTPYKRCDMSLVPCKDGYYEFCLEEKFLNDGVVNCPFTGCTDEGSCAQFNERDGIHLVSPEDTESLDTGAKVILSAVTSLIVSFIMFIACIWLCKKTGRFCWSVNCAGRSSEPTSTTQSSRVIEMESRREVAAPTAPEADKDMPPSYDSLFPSR